MVFGDASISIDSKDGSFINGSFPICSMSTIFASYFIWFILLIYSFIKYKETEDKPKLIRWYMFGIIYLILPFSHMIFMGIIFYIFSFIINL